MLRCLLRCLFKILRFSGMQPGCWQCHGVVFKRCDGIACMLVCTHPLVLFGASIMSSQMRLFREVRLQLPFCHRRNGKIFYTYVDDGCLAHHSFKTSESSFLITQRKHSSNLRVDSGVRLGC